MPETLVITEATSSKSRYPSHSLQFRVCCMAFKLLCEETVLSAPSSISFLTLEVRPGLNGLKHNSCSPASALQGLLELSIHTLEKHWLSLLFFFLIRHKLMTFKQCSDTALSPLLSRATLLSGAGRIWYKHFRGSSGGYHVCQELGTELSLCTVAKLPYWLMAQLTVPSLLANKSSSPRHLTGAWDTRKTEMSEHHSGH